VAPLPLCARSTRTGCDGIADGPCCSVDGGGACAFLFPVLATLDARSGPAMASPTGDFVDRAETAAISCDPPVRIPSMAAAAGRSGAGFIGGAGAGLMVLPVLLFRDGSCCFPTNPTLPCGC